MESPRSTGSPPETQSQQFSLCGFFADWTRGQSARLRSRRVSQNGCLETLSSPEASPFSRPEPPEITEAANLPILTLWLGRGPRFQQKILSRNRPGFPRPTPHGSMSMSMNPDTLYVSSWIAKVSNTRSVFLGPDPRNSHGHCLWAISNARGEQYVFHAGCFPPTASHNLVRWSCLGHGRGYELHSFSVKGWARGSQQSCSWFDQRRDLKIATATCTTKVSGDVPLS